jgi:hypothetical protein
MKTSPSNGDIVLVEEALVPEAVHRELSRTHPDLPSFLEVRQAQDRAAACRL